MSKLLSLLLVGLSTSALAAGRIGGAPSSGGFTAGQDVTGDDGVFKTLQSTGTAPSLTATGAEFGSSITVRATAGQSAALFATAADEGQIRLCNRTRGAACSFGSNGLYQLGIGNSGTFAIYGEGETFLSYSYPNIVFNNTAVKLGIGTASPLAKLSVNGDVSVTGPSTFASSITVTNADITMNAGYYLYWADTSAAIFRSGVDLRLDAPTNGTIRLNADNRNVDFQMEGDTNDAFFLLDGGAEMVGIGTASPATKLDVVGDAQFGSGVNKATVTAGGFWQPLSQTTLQASLLAPTSLGQYIQNATTNELCKSTGTSAGNWQKVDGGGGCF